MTDVTKVIFLDLWTIKINVYALHTIEKKMEQEDLQKIRVEMSIVQKHCYHYQK